MSQILSMYEGQEFSPVTALSEDFLAGSTTMSVEDASVLPDAPNYLVLGEYGDEYNETISYTGISNNTVTGITRAIEGDEHTFSVGTKVARSFTAKDLNVVQANIRTLNSSKVETASSSVANNFVSFNDLGGIKDSGKNPDSFQEKENGKGLSTNDFTNELKNKYDGYQNTKEDSFSKNTAFNKSFGDGSGEVCEGNDGRLSDSRSANDVYAWAKEETKPTYTASEIGLGNVPNVSTNNQTPTFTEATTRTNILSGDKINILFGKIKKYFADLKAVAFSGSYNDLSDKPDVPEDSSVIGEIKIIAMAVPPAKWLNCEGQSLSKTTYAELFAAIGYTYGGSGNEFMLPDLCGRVVAGLGTTANFDTIGKKVGEETHKLSINEMPSHGHIISVNKSENSSFSGSGTGITVNSGRQVAAMSGVATASSTGGDAPHNNIQPTITMNYIIYTGVE